MCHGFTLWFNFIFKNKSDQLEWLLGTGLTPNACLSNSTHVFLFALWSSALKSLAN